MPPVEQADIPDGHSLSNEELQALDAEEAAAAPTSPVGIPSAPTQVPSLPEWQALTQPVAAPTTNINALPSFLQNFGQGMENFRVRGGLMFRDITDSLGLTDPDKTKEGLAKLEAGNQAALAAATAAGHSTAGEAGQFLGNMIPGVLVGAATGGATGMGVMGQAGVGSAVQGGLMSGGSGVTNDALNATISGVGGTLLGSGTVAKQAVQSYINKAVDPAKVAMFRETGIQPLMSQVIRDTSPKVKATFQAIEKVANQLPFGLGIKGATQSQANGAARLVTDVTRELDSGHVGTKNLLNSIKTNVSPDNQLPMTNTHNVANAELSKYINPADTNSYNPQALQFLKTRAGITGSPPVHDFEGAWAVKHNIDQQIKMLKRAGVPEDAPELHSMYAIRNAAAQDVKELAHANGVGAQYNQYNKAAQNDMVNDKFAKAFKAAYTDTDANGNHIVGGAFNMKKFNTELTKAGQWAKAQKLKVPEETSKAINNAAGIVHAIVNSTAKGSTGGTGIVSGSLGLGAMKMAYGYAKGLTGSDPAAAATVAALAGVAKGISHLISTDAGIKALSQVNPAKLGTPYGRLAITSALGLGLADHSVDPSTYHHTTPSLDILRRQANAPEGNSLSQQELEDLDNEED